MTAAVEINGATASVRFEQGRRAVGFELKESYHALAERNIRRVAAGESVEGQQTLALAGEAA